MGVRDDFLRERDAFRATLGAVGPGAPTTCGSWTTTDLAVHFALGEVAGAVANAPFRMLVRAGVRLDRMAPVNARALASYARRHDFDWALRRLARPAPWLHGTAAIAAVSLLEVWAHHEDVLGANPIGPCTTGVDLTPVIAVLTRYQRTRLQQMGAHVATSEREWFRPRGAIRLEIAGSADEVARRLAGRAAQDPQFISLTI